MKHKTGIWLAALPLAMMTLSALSLEKIFYINASSSKSVDLAMTSIENNAKAIDVVGPQSLNVNANGEVTGEVPQKLIQLARKNNIKILPLVVNSWFQSKEDTHRFLNSNKAQQRAIKKLVSFAKNNDFPGLQIDFENMYNSDRERFTHFYQKLAAELHKNNLQVSIAIMALTDISLKNSVFDIKELGEVSNFISVMTYDQHYAGSTPGAVASVPYDIKNIKLILEYVPADKVSLGIPSYGYHWTSNNGKYHGKYIGHEQVAKLKLQHGIKSKWNTDAEVPYFNYYYAGNKYTVYYENKKSFDAKLALAKKYKLQGISD